MSEAMIDDLLDVLVPPVEQLPDWNGVLRRATRVRRRRAVLAAAVFALVVVPAAYAVARAFEGTPGPPQIRESFTRWNGMADQINRLAVRRGFRRHAPHALASTAHGVLQIRTSDGPLDLWAARAVGGGICWFVDYEADVRPGKVPLGGGSCDQPRQPRLTFELGWTYTHPTLEALDGRVNAHASTVRVWLSGGSDVRLPVVEGLFLGSLPDHTRVQRIDAYAADGKRVATFSPSSAR